MNTARLRSVPAGILVAVLAALLDLTVRNTSAVWTESPIAQWAVYFSPTVYIALLAVLLLKLSPLPSKLSSSTMKAMAVALCVFSIAILVQILTRGRSVGSANYSVVLPLFVSGIPLAVLTFIVFFRKSRDAVASAFVTLIAILWILMPIGIDAMYVSQEGYRGSVGMRESAVIGTTYDLLQAFAALGFFVCVLAALPIVLGGIYFAVRSPRSEKLYVVAMVLSLLALSLQFVNWGGFVWD